jgi:hypothetical protein
MRLEGPALQLGMILHADEPGMVGIFDVSGSTPSGDMPEKTQAVAAPDDPCNRIDLVAMAVALGNDIGRSVDRGDLRLPLLQMAG